VGGQGRLIGGVPDGVGGVQFRNSVRGDVGPRGILA
jgi:hypothetical protein